jgi:hypothetical protein
MRLISDTWAPKITGAAKIKKGQKVTLLTGETVVAETESWPEEGRIYCTFKTHYGTFDFESKRWVGEKRV